MKRIIIVFIILFFWTSIVFGQDGLPQGVGGAGTTHGNGANCAAGNYPLGVDENGAVESCTAAAGGGTMTTVKEGNVQVGDADQITIDFGPGFDVSESPDTETNITLDLTEKQVDLTTEVTGVLPDANIADDITVDLADTATALAANGANCTVGQYPLGVDASGAVETCTSIGASTLPVVDTTSIVEGSADATKEMRIDVETEVSTGTVRVWTAPDFNINLGELRGDIVNVMVHGAKIDGVTDDTAAINAALAAATPGESSGSPGFVTPGQIVVCPFGATGEAVITDTIVIPAGIRWKQNCAFDWQGADNKPVLQSPTTAEAAAGTNNFGATFDGIFIRNDSQNNWAFQSDSLRSQNTGFLLSNCEYCRVKLKLIWGFRHGIQLAAEASTSSNHNQIFGGSLINNKFPIGVWPVSGATNNNSYRDIKIRNDICTNIGVSRYGVYFPSPGGSSQDSNKFEDISFELQADCAEDEIFTFVPADVNTSTDQITVTGHTYSANERISFQTDADSTLPAGLVNNILYYAVSVASNVFDVSLTSGGASVDITDTGTGIFTVIDGAKADASTDNIEFWATSTVYATDALVLNINPVPGEKPIIWKQTAASCTSHSSGPGPQAHPFDTSVTEPSGICDWLWVEPAQATAIAFAALGGQNYFRDIRHEADGSIMAVLSHNTNGDWEFDASASTEKTTDSWRFFGGGGHAATFSTGRTRLHADVKYWWHSGNLPNNTTVADGSGDVDIQIAGMHVGTTSSEFSLIATMTDDTTDVDSQAIAGEYLNLDNGFFVGVGVDTTENKRWIVARDVDPGTGGLAGDQGFIYLCPYDGNPLTGGQKIDGSADTGALEGNTIWGASFNRVFYHSGSTCFRQFVPRDDEGWFFWVNDTVKFVVVSQRGGSIKTMSIGSLDLNPVNVFPLHGVMDGDSYMNKIPDEGLFPTIGEKIKDSTGTTAGWTVTTKGGLTRHGDWAAAQTYQTGQWLYGDTAGTPEVWEMTDASCASSGATEPNGAGPTFDDDNCNWKLIALKAALTVISPGSGKQTLWIPATAMRPTVTAGSAVLSSFETTAGSPDILTLDFSDTVVEHSQFSVSFPKSWDEGTITFQPTWTKKATPTGGLDGVIWGLQGLCVADDASLDDTYGTEITITTDQAQSVEDLWVGVESAAVTLKNAAEDTVCPMQATRQALTAGDDMDVDAGLVGYRIFYTTDAENDD